MGPADFERTTMQMMTRWKAMQFREVGFTGVAVHTEMSDLKGFDGAAGEAPGRR